VLTLQYLAPPPELAEYISAFYLFECDEGELSDIERADIAQVRILIAGEAHVEFPDGTQYPLYPACLIGPRLTATRVVAKSDGMMRMFGFGLQPAGWALSVQKPAHTYANTIYPAGEMFSGDMEGYAARIHAAATLAEMVEITTSYSRVFLREASPSPLWFIRAVEQWLESSMLPDITALEERTGLSRRQIERQCKQFYGAPPKFLMRKYRALRSANAIANGGGDWQECIDEAYYDQPHFIREIKEFTGMTPGAIRNSTSRISALTFGRAQLAGDVKPLVSAT